MPQLNKTYTLTVTPEQFLQACSDTERWEVGILLSSARFRGSEQTEQSEQPEHCLVQESTDAAINDLMDVFPGRHNEALAIIRSFKMAMPLDEVLPAMRGFRMLEQLRIQCLVKLPQNAVETDDK